MKFFPAIKGINLTDECGPGEPPLPARSVPRGRGRAADFYTMAREDAVLP
ncbi:hypothetical protein B4096_0910 [Heyndrickxia coagulans]|nr:hypothetical protein B4100_0967 [Heyndrickxia coagulans]KYC73096.1 hypothetical protein B4096_0910 [Heyndrickxia coagulans]